MSLLLNSDDGERFSLTIEGYEFPNLVGHRDSNWLVIRMCMTSGGQTWEIVDPCFMVGEYAELIEWMRTVEQAEEPDPYYNMENTLRFTKGSVNDESVIMVNVTIPHKNYHETFVWPPWVDRHNIDPNGFKRSYPFRVNDMQAVADAMQEQLNQYPCRWHLTSEND